MSKKKITNCAFCKEYITPFSKREHTQRHVNELTEIYRQLSEKEGVKIQFGSQCHSICCHQHTVQLRTSHSHYINVGEFIHFFRRAIQSIFNHPFLRQARIRAQFIIYATFESNKEWDGKGTQKTQQGVFTSRIQTITPLDTDERINEAISYIEPKIENFRREKSGWTLKSLDALSIKITAGVNHSGGGPVLIPSHLKKCRYICVLRGGMLSDHCFETSVRYVLAQQSGMNMRAFRDVNKVDSCLREKFPLDIRDMPFPFESKYFHTFERRNNVALRVYLHDGSRVRGTLYAKPAEPQTQKVYLLYLANEEQPEKFPGHFLPITNMRALVNDIDKASKRQLGFFCDFCLKGFRYENEYHLHSEFCSKIEKPQRCVLPPKLTEHKFRDHHKTTRPINTVYADIEALLRPQEDGSKTHVPIAVASQTVWHDHFQKDSTEQHVFIGESCISQFLDHLEDIMQNNIKLLEKTREKISMNSHEQKRHDAATHCAFCEIEFDYNDKNKLKCADHDHISSLYLQALCTHCNFLRRQTRYRMAVVFHNLQKYDSHHLMRYGLLKRLDWNISPLYQSGSNCLGIRVDIPIKPEMESKAGEEKKHTQNEDEKMMKMRRTYKIDFIDSLQFLKASLDSLASNLESTPITGAMLKRYYGLSEAACKYNKGIFPYNFLDSMECLKTTQLPPIEAFYNDLTAEPCSLENYEKAKQAWKDAGCVTFEEYMIYYLKMDVALLSDCFEKFRKTAFERAGLDPVHYFGIPGFTFSYAYKYTGMKLQALPTIDMYLTFENGLRGGMTFINTHHIEAWFDEKNKLFHHIIYVDENSLYGSAMSMKLPKNGFRQMNMEEIEMLTNDWFINSFDPQGDTGYIIRCDLEYPPECQNDTMDLPLAPESGMISWDDLSNFSKQEWERQRGAEPFVSSRKLLLTHHDKHNYVVHSTILKYYLTKGLRLKKVHEAIEFHQEAYLKPYVDYHTEARSKTTTEEAKSFHKLNVNALFGKTMENPRKYKKSYVVRKPQYLFRHASSPLCDSVFIMDENTCIVNMRKSEVQLNKPVFIGQSILDNSKMIMYQRLDSWKSNPLIENLELLGGDTDSLFLHVTSKHTRNEILKSFGNDFDASNYPSNHPLYSKANKSKLGCFKDETQGEAIQSLLMQAPKTYSILTENDHRTARAKGIQRHIRDKISHYEYRQTQLNHEMHTVSQTSIRSNKHFLHTVTQSKRALACWDSKRFWLDDNNSVPYGHHRINQFLENIALPDAGTNIGEIPAKRRRIEEPLKHICA